MNWNLLAAAPLLILSGCTSWLAETIVTAPKEATVLLVPDQVQAEIEAEFEWKTFKVPVSDTGVRIAVTVLPPRNYFMDYEFLSFEDFSLRAKFDMGNGDGELEPVIKPISGTAILLPGATMGRYSLMPWALGLAAEGYRTVMVDHRGHGDSTGRYITFGGRESHDLREVVAALDARNLIAQPLIFLGTSMGATTALLAAPHLEDLDAVVALEPYTDAPGAISTVGRALNPRLSPFVSDQRLREAISRASEIADYALTEVRPIDVMDHINIPVLFIHGRDDTWVPPQNSIDLYLAKDGRSQLWVIPGAAHMTLPMQYNKLSARVFDWLDEVLTAPESDAMYERRH